MRSLEANLPRAGDLKMKLPTLPFPHITVGLWRPRHHWVSVRTELQVAQCTLPLPISTQGTCTGLSP